MRAGSGPGARRRSPECAEPSETGTAAPSSASPAGLIRSGMEDPAARLAGAVRAACVAARDCARPPAAFWCGRRRIDP